MSDFNPANSPLVGYGASVATSDPPFTDSIHLAPVESGGAFTPNPTDDLGAAPHVAVYVGTQGG